MTSPKTKIVNAITVMATAWGITMDQPRLKIYLEALLDLPPGAVEKAVGHLIKTRSFAGNIPVVAEIREAAEEYLADEHYLLDGPCQKKVFITPENAHLYADKSCPTCGGKGSYPGNFPSRLGGILDVTVRCDCVKEPERRLN
jgi:hypothetical protein